MRNRQWLSTVAVAAGLAFAVGCGGSEPSDEEAIKDAVAGYFDGFAAADGEEACSHLTDEAAQEMTGGLSGGLPDVDDSTCESSIQGVAELSEQKSIPTPDGEVTSVDISGDTAVAHLAGNGTKVEMVKEDGEWLMSSGFVQE